MGFTCTVYGYDTVITLLCMSRKDGGMRGCNIYQLSAAYEGLAVYSTIL